jgi:hypothetical protein
MQTRLLVAAFIAATALTSQVLSAQQPGGGAAPAAPAAPPAPMTFFITSVSPGTGANLGGLAGADAHCAKLAAASGAAGAAGKTWRAYLSTQGTGAVNARDRIGKGPWHNAKGELIANNVEDLHGDVERDRNNITKASALNEKGEMINGRGDTPNRHDILTGSTSHGRAFTDAADHTCKNYTDGTSPQGQGSVHLGHHDRNGGGNTSWNAAHASRGCSQDNLKSSGGDALLYCFAQ